MTGENNTKTPSPATPASSEVAVLMVPLPAQGHLNQLLHLSILLSSAYGVSVHYAAAATHNRQAKLRLSSSSSSASAAVHFHDLEAPPFPSPPPSSSAATNFPTHLIPALTAAPALLRRPLSLLLSSLSAAHRRLAVVHDSLMGGAVQDSVHLSNVNLYAFHSTSVFNTVALRWHLYGKPSSLTSELLRVLTREDLDSIPGLHLFWPEEMTEFMVSQYGFLRNCEGRIFNSCRAVEGEFVDMIERYDRDGNKYWALGPFIPTGVQGGGGEGGVGVGMEWLGQQPERSVLYVCFGTTTTMCFDQVVQLAKGLENSRQRFLWVLHHADTGDIFSEEGGEGRKKKLVLPEGYEERVRGRGMVVREWVPQRAILGHSSTGGFLSHCGWNSCMESLCFGVPLIAWPMHSDQTSNSILITKVLRVGLAVADLALLGEVVAAPAVEAAARRLMATPEGDRLRHKAAELRGLVLESVGEGGAARKEMDSFFSYLCR